MTVLRLRNRIIELSGPANAIATYSASSSAAVTITGNSVSHTATASGGVTLPGGQSASDQITNGEIFFGNAGTEDITITLGIHWAYSVMASTSSANRKAFAFANLIVDTLIFDAIGEQVGEDIFHVDELATANGSSGTFETFTDTATLSIDVIVLTGPVTSVGIFVDARGPPKCRRLLLRCCFIYPPSCK